MYLGNFLGKWAKVGAPLRYLPPISYYVSPCPDRPGRTGRTISCFSSDRRAISERGMLGKWQKVEGVGRARRELQGTEVIRPHALMAEGMGRHERDTRRGTQCTLGVCDLEFRKGKGEESMHACWPCGVQNGVSPVICLSPG